MKLRSLCRTLPFFWDEAFQEDMHRTGVFQLSFPQAEAEELSSYVLARWESVALAYPKLRLKDGELKTHPRWCVFLALTSLLWLWSCAGKTKIGKGFHSYENTPNNVRYRAFQERCTLALQSQDIELLAADCEGFAKWLTFLVDQVCCVVLCTGVQLTFDSGVVGTVPVPVSQPRTGALSATRSKGT